MEIISFVTNLIKYAHGIAVLCFGFSYVHTFVVY